MRAKWWIGLVLVVGIIPQAPAQTLVVLGDSISAGLGLEIGQGWVTLLSERLAARTPAVKVVNASISGDTTAGGRSRLPAVLAEHHPRWLLVELGGNDGLRGLTPAQMQENLSAIVEMARKQNAKVLLLGVKLPPNYGERYTRAFDGVFPKVAQAYQVPLVPYLMQGIGAEAAMMQADGIHPNAKAQPKLLENVWPALEPLLQ